MVDLFLRVDVTGRGRIGPGKIRLLEQIARTGSISAAGRAMGMSYRRAWDSSGRVERLVLVPGRDNADWGIRRRRRRPRHSPATLSLAIATWRLPRRRSPSTILQPLRASFRVGRPLAATACALPYHRLGSILSRMRMACCHDDHCATPGRDLNSPQWRRALWIALAVNAGFFAAEIVVALPPVHPPCRPTRSISSGTPRLRHQSRRGRDGACRARPRCASERRHPHPVRPLGRRGNRGFHRSLRASSSGPRHSFRPPTDRSIILTI